MNELGQISIDFTLLDKYQNNFTEKDKTDTYSTISTLDINVKTGYQNLSCDIYQKFAIYFATILLHPSLKILDTSIPSAIPLKQRRQYSMNKSHSQKITNSLSILKS